MANLASLALFGMIIAMTEHMITEKDGEFVCSVCGSSWRRRPGNNALPCPGMPVYWDWNTAPEFLMTKRQLSEKGLSAGAAVPVACLPNTRRNREKGHLWIWLYDSTKAESKKPLTPAQVAARERLIEKNRKARTCKRCEVEKASRSDLKGGICGYCHYEIMISDARAAAAKWAREKLSRSDWVVLDFETTGLDNPEAVQVAVVAPDGQELFYSLIRPTGEIEIEAIAIHGITQEMVANAPVFPEIYSALAAVLIGKTIVAYNADFDRGVFAGECRRYGLPRLDLEWECAMVMYAQWHGEWSDYWEDFKWQALPGGDHTALGDCRAVLGLMRRIAGESELVGDE